MKINIMKKGDRVLSVTAEFIAIERKNKEVDIVPLHKEENSLWVDTEQMVTIGFGDNTVETTTAEGVVVTNF